MMKRTSKKLREEARSQAVSIVNSAMVLAYWQIGREVVEFVQRGTTRSGYGERKRSPRAKGRK